MTLAKCRAQAAVGDNGVLREAGAKQNLGALPSLYKGYFLRAPPWLSGGDNPQLPPFYSWGRARRIFPGATPSSPGG